MEGSVAVSPSGALEADSERAVQKAFRRVLPWCMVFYVIAYLDRINIGFAALTMNTDLGLTATMFGLANTLFYIVYVGFEAPSTLMLARYGARRWIPRIMITWGLASMATVFAVGAYSLYGLRMLVGLAEAGLTPGLLFYVSQWFPREHRARANGLFLASLPLALIIGAPLSGLILQMNGWLGLSGWRWVFLLEGLPPIAVGTAVLFFLPNGPRDANWLSPQERDALVRRLEGEGGVHPAKTDWAGLVSPLILMLSAVYFCIQATLNTLGIWTPQIVKGFLGPASSALLVTLISAAPPVFSLAAMILVSRDSDRLRMRAPYVVCAMAVGAVGWVLVALGPTPMSKLAGLTLAFAGVYSAICVFWAAATQRVGRRSQAAAIGVISTLGTTASIVSPYIIGTLRDLTHSFTASIWYVAVLLVLGGGAMAALSSRPAEPVNA